MRITQLSPVVLVVEPDPSIRQLLVLMLARCGVTVQPFASGPEALAWLDSESQTPALAIIDSFGPRLSGLDILVELRTLRPDLRCCVSGGYIADDTPLFTAGACHVLHKPYSVDDVADCLAKTLPSQSFNPTPTRASATGFPSVVAAPAHSDCSPPPSASRAIPRPHCCLARQSGAG